jgi:PAS domain S-box-containing protein
MVDNSNSDLNRGVYGSIFKSSLDAMLITKPDGSILAANPSAEKMFRMTQEEIIIAGRERLLVQDESLKSALHQCVQNGRVKAELTFQRKDGSLFHGEVTSTIFTDADGMIKTSMSIRDITPRKQNEKALKESKARYKSLYETMIQGVVYQDKKGRIVSMNPAAEKIMGYTFEQVKNRTSEDPIWQAIHEDYTPFPGDEHPSMVALKTGKEVKNVIMGVKYPPRGGYTWLNIHAVPEFENGQDKPYQVYTTFEDITEHRKIEEELKRHAALLDVSYEAIFSWNFDSKILSWNQGAERLYGYSYHEAIGARGHELLKTEFTGGFQEILKKLDQDQTWSGELIHQMKNGKKIIVESRLQLITDISGEKIVLETNRDVTNRKKVEEKLKEAMNNLEEQVEERTQELIRANDYNRNLIETSLDPQVTIGPDGRITDVNRATEKVTGYSRVELIGTDFADYFTNPEDAKKGYQQVFQYGLVRDYPLEIKHKNNSLTPVLYNASVYRDEHGEVVGVFAAARDITERKNAEEELRKYWENLEEQVKLRTEELAKSNADLKQFAYVASHDLREPLRMITNFLQLLERRYKDKLDDDAREFINFAVDGAKRLDSMIIDLLEYSRIANKDVMFREVDLDKVLDKIKLNLNIAINENHAQITHDSLPTTLRADENQMVLLFQNLIGNAIKYRSETEPQIHVSCKKQRNFFQFSVRDNGIGIEPKHLERIFTIFQRLHTHQEYEGSGIGLSIAQRIVHQHGGEIWAESELGDGSTFYFTLRS